MHIRMKEPCLCQIQKVQRSQAHMSAVVEAAQHFI